MEVDSGKLSSLTSSSSSKVTSALANQLVTLSSKYYQAVANNKLTAETRWLAVWWERVSGRAQVTEFTEFTELFVQCFLTIETQLLALFHAESASC